MPPDPFPPVVIGAREIYDQLLATDRKVDTVSGQLVQVAQGHGDHETRIRKLERVVWIASGAAATGGGLVGAVVRQAIGGG